jgi:Phage tail protein (Tail_P2_I)
MSGQILFERNLLPPNATRYERSLESGMRIPEEIWQRALLLASAKNLLPDDVIPFLLWEYGLEPVMQWVDDPRRVLREGRDWQKIRGTPASIEKALSWIEFNPLWLEEHADETWWDTFQLAFPEAITSRNRLEAIFGLTRLSKPAHTELIRVYNTCYDLRPVLINGGHAGAKGINGSALLNDWSGIWLEPGWPKISFCRVDTDLVDMALPDSAFTNFHHALAFDISRRSWGFQINRHLINSDEIIDPSTDVGSHIIAELFERTSSAFFNGPWGDQGWRHDPYGYPYFRDLGFIIADAGDTIQVDSLETDPTDFSFRFAEQMELADLDEAYPNAPWPDRSFQSYYTISAYDQVRFDQDDADIVSAGGYPNSPWPSGMIGSATFAGHDLILQDDIDALLAVAQPVSIDTLLADLHDAIFVPSPSENSGGVDQEQITIEPLFNNGGPWSLGAWFDGPYGSEVMSELGWIETTIAVGTSVTTTVAMASRLSSRLRAGATASLGATAAAAQSVNAQPTTAVVASAKLTQTLRSTPSATVSLSASVGIEVKATATAAISLSAIVSSVASANPAASLAAAAKLAASTSIDSATTLVSVSASGAFAVSAAPAITGTATAKLVTAASAQPSVSLSAGASAAVVRSLSAAPMTVAGNMATSAANPIGSDLTVDAALTPSLAGSIRSSPRVSIIVDPTFWELERIGGVTVGMSTAMTAATGHVARATASTQTSFVTSATHVLSANMTVSAVMSAAMVETRLLSAAMSVGTGAFAKLSGSIGGQVAASVSMAGAARFALTSNPSVTTSLTASLKRTVSVSAMMSVSTTMSAGAVLIAGYPLGVWPNAQYPA